MGTNFYRPQQRTLDYLINMWFISWSKLHMKYLRWDFFMAFHLLDPLVSVWLLQPVCARDCEYVIVWQTLKDYCCIIAAWEGESVINWNDFLVQCPSSVKHDSEKRITSRFWDFIPVYKQWSGINLHFTSTELEYQSTSKQLKFIQKRRYVTLS